MASLQSPAHSNRRTVAIVQLIVVNVLWGVSFLASREALNLGMPPMTLAALRYIFVLPFLFVLLRAREGRVLPPRGTIRHLALSGFLGIALYYYFEYTGLQFTTASTASMILAAIPVFTLLYERIFLHTPLPRAKRIGALLSAVGVVLVAFTEQSDALPQAWLGNLLILGCCLTWVFYVEASKRLSSGISGLCITTWQSALALLVLVPGALLGGGAFGPFPPRALLIAALLGLLCSGLAYLWYIASIRVLGSVTSSTFINLMPVVTVAVGMWLGEPVTPVQLAGGAVVLASLFLVTYQPRAGRAAA